MMLKLNIVELTDPRMSNSQAEFSKSQSYLKNNLQNFIVKAFEMNF